MDAVAEIKARVDIVDLVSRYATLRRMGAVYKCNCPFHNERTPSFVVYPNEGRWHCFGACAMGGDIFNFLMKKENLDFREALERLAQEAGVSLEDRSNPEQARRATIHEVNDAAAGFYQHILLTSPAAQGARAYLQKRQIDDATIERFRLGYVPDNWTPLRDYLLNKGYKLELLVEAGLVKHNDERTSTYDVFRGRVVIPIRDRAGKVIGFGGRVLGDGVPKYLNTPETPVFHKSHVVYGIDLAGDAIRAADKVVIVEGYMDVIAAHQHGFANVVACMGTAITPDQLRQLQRYTSNFILALDADAAGEAATLRGLNQARQSLTRVSRPTVLPGGKLAVTQRLGANISILSIPLGKDPDDLIRSDLQRWQALVDDATPLVDFYFGVTARRFDLKTPQGKGQAVAELTPLIAELDDEIERQHYIHQLSRLVQVDESIIENRVRADANAARKQALRMKEQSPASEPFAGDDSIPNDLGANGDDFGDLPLADNRPARRGDRTAKGARREYPRRSEPGSRTAPIRPGRVITPEDHLLAMLLREPDMLVVLTHSMELLGENPPMAQDFLRSENQEIFNALKLYLTSDEMWDLELFQERLAPPLHPILGALLSYAAMLPMQPLPELREGVIKDIVRLRLSRLKNESTSVKFLVDEAQENGARETALLHGSKADRIVRELDHLQPLKARANLQPVVPRHNRLSEIRPHGAAGGDHHPNQNSG